MKVVKMEWHATETGLEESLHVNGVLIAEGDCHDISKACVGIERTFNVIGVPFKTRMVNEKKER